MTTNTLDDWPTSEVVRGFIAVIVGVALFFTVFPFESTDELAPPGFAAQIALIGIIVMTMLFVNIHKTVFPFVMAFTLVASGMVKMFSTTTDGRLALGIAAATLGSIYFWWRKNPEKLRVTPLDDDDELVLPTEAEMQLLDADEIEMLRALKPGLQRIVEDLDNAVDYERTTAATYIATIDHAITHGFAGDVMPLYVKIAEFVEGGVYDGPN